MCVGMRTYTLASVMGDFEINPDGTIFLFRASFFRSSRLVILLLNLSLVVQGTSFNLVEESSCFSTQKRLERNPLYSTELNQTSCDCLLRSDDRSLELVSGWGCGSFLFYSMHTAVLACCLLCLEVQADGWVGGCIKLRLKPGFESLFMTGR